VYADCNYMLDSGGGGVCKAHAECAEWQFGVGPLLCFGHNQPIPSRSGELQLLPEVALCVLIVVSCLSVTLECAQHVWSGNVVLARLMLCF